MDYKIASVATQWWINQMKKQCKKYYPDKITGDDSNLIIEKEHPIYGYYFAIQNNLSRKVAEIIQYHEERVVFILTADW